MHWFTFILKTPAFMLLGVFFMILYFLGDEKPNRIGKKLISGQIPDQETIIFVKKYNDLSNHLTIILFLTILAYYILR